MSEQWITAWEAYSKVVAHIPMRATEAICERAFDGMIAARAERPVWGTKVLEDADIPREFWWARGRAAMKAIWPSGDFDTYVDDRRTHCRAYGVEFARKDIDRMLPQARSVDFATAAAGNYAPAAQCRAELMQSLKCSGATAGRLILQYAEAGLLVGGAPKSAGVRKIATDLRTIRSRMLKSQSGSGRIAWRVTATA